MTLAPGTPLGPYEILAPLGAGGMGEVYRARDTRLRREVAIKVLPAKFAADPERLLRFEQEAHAVAALNHPNIVALYDVGSHEEAPFVVTELLEGETLKDRLGGGPLSPRTAVEIGVQIAQGLSAAHAKGVIHRDVKPANVFVTGDGVVKILDFGLAKLVRAEEAASPEGTTMDRGPRTESGTVLGTMGYISPEQLRGEEADARSDIFGFGCVLYEMLSGKSPFLRATGAETITAIMSQDPPALSGTGRAISPALEEIVRRCLEKHSADRFSSAHDLALALRAQSGASEVPVGVPSVPAAERPRVKKRWAAAAAGAAALIAIAAGILFLRGRLPVSPSATTLNPKRILVLPFENVTGDSSLDPLGRMTADWISQGLLQTENIEVVTLGVGPGAVTTKPHEELKTLAVKNSAGTVVSGSYYASGKDLEFQARLTDAVAGKLLFALEPVRGPREQPMQAIDRVRQWVMGAVIMRFSLSKAAAVIQKPPLYEAYKEYIAGFESIGIDNEKTRKHLERAVALDPDFIVAQIRLAAVYSFVGDTARSEALFAKLRDSTEKMTPAEHLLLDVQLANIGRNLIEGYQAARSLHALVPKDWVAVLHHARFALWTNRPRECLETFATLGPWEALLNEEPGRWRQFTWYVAAAAQAHHLLGEHDEELAVARLGLKQFPDMLLMHLQVACALAALGRTAELDQALEASLSAPVGRTLTPGLVIVMAAQELRAHGHADAARKVAGRAANWYAAHLAKEPAKERLAAEQLWALCLLEQWDEARSSAVKSATVFPDSIDMNGYQGLLAARAGDRKGAESASTSLTRFRTGDALAEATYWRACIAAQLGDREGAVALLREAFTQGVPLIVAAHADWRLDPLQGYVPFEELIKPRG